MCFCNVIFSIAQKFLCVCLAMCISIYIYDCCVFAVNQGVFAVHATFGPLHRGGSRQWNQEVLCLTQPPPSSSTHCKGIWQCKESSSHSAAALLQCRETRHAQNVPPFSHSGGGRPLLPVTDLNHRIFSILDIRFTHGRFYRLICALCVFCNQLLSNQLSLSKFFPRKGNPLISAWCEMWKEWKCCFCFFGRCVQILNLILSTWCPVILTWWQLKVGQWFTMVKD